ncbi:MAG: fused MFS/spermidine synthase [Dehalococcoidia bacterium]
MAFLVVFLAVGFGETVGQVVLIRELLTNFQGNELSLGVILACWLLMTALGSWGLGKFAEKISARPSAFVFTVILYALILLLQLLLARAVNTIIGIGPGEIAGLASIFLACLIVLTPLCLLHGFQFPFACRILAAQRGTAPVQVGRLYIAEALGSMAGGVLFAYIMVHYLDHLGIATFIILFNLVSAFFLLRPHRSLRFFFRKLVLVVMCLVAIISLGTGALSRLDFLSSQWQWREHELVSVENSVYQNIAVTRKGGQLNFFANGVLLFTTPVPDIEFVEEIAHFPLLHHANPRNVLLVGGGLGGELAEIIKHPVENVFYVEPDPRIIQTAEKYLPDSPLDEARITVEYTDGRLFVERTEAKFDVVVMNLPPPATLQVNRFYTSEFFEAVRDILGDLGVFAFGLPSSEAYMGEEMIRLNRSVYTTLTEVFPAVSVIPNDFTIFLASTDPVLLALDVEEISQRFEERALATRLFTSRYIEHKLSPERISRLTAYLHEAGEINRDRRPISTFHNLALWNAMFHPGLKGVFDLALALRVWWLLPFLLLFLLPVLKNIRRKEFMVSPVILALFSSGFAGMTFTIVLLFSFQVSYGHLYQKIGILTAAFMLGLALGGWLMSRSMGILTRDVPILGWTVLAVALYACLLPWLTLLASGIAAVPGEVPFALLNLVGGFLLGLQFPLANKICLQRTAGVAPAVGLLYAADLWGGVLGALLSSVLLIPVLGIVNTCLLAGALSLTAFAVLFISSGRYRHMPGR